MSVDVKNFKPSKNFEAKCLKDLEKIRDKILSIFKKYSNSAFNIPDLLKQITNTKDFQEFTDTLAKRFFARCVDKNNDTFRKSFFGRAYKIFKNLTGDEDLITFIQNQVDEKANLFKSIPIELANSLIPHVNEWALEGKTSKGIFDDLKNKLPDLLDFQIRRIARTEISKTLTDITEFKCGQGEVNIYQWKASGGERGDGRTRYSHRKMANVLIMWGDPPAPEDLFPIYGKNGRRYKNTLGHYHAGCCPNCRCVAMPVVSLSDIEFPARIYSNGAIRKINKKDLLKLLNIDDKPSIVENNAPIEVFEPKQAEEEARKEEELRKALEEELRKAEEAKKKAEEEQKKKEEEIRKAEEEAKKKAEEEAKRQAEEERRKFQEEKKKAIEEREKRLAEKKAKEEAEAREKEEKKRKAEEEAINIAKATKQKIEVNRRKLEEDIKQDEKKTQEELEKETSDFLKTKLNINSTFKNFTYKDQVINVKKSFKQIDYVLSAIVNKKDRKYFNLKIKNFATNQDLFDELKEEYLEKKLTPIIDAEEKRLGKKPPKRWRDRQAEKILKDLKNKLDLLENKNAFTETMAFVMSEMQVRRLIDTSKAPELAGMYINYNTIEELNYFYDPSQKMNFFTNYFKDHPPFTDNAEGTIYHEWGHILDNTVELANVQEIRDIFEENLENYNKWYELIYKKNMDFTDAWNYLKSQDKDFDFLSTYAFVHKDLAFNNPYRYVEFIAEATSEFLTSANPRPIALKVWGIIERKIKEYIERQKKNG